MVSMGMASRYLSPDRQAEGKNVNHEREIHPLAQLQSSSYAHAH